ncbi:hypothetical protein BpHYR1_040725 [Brachionus plicatilis]|uniref:Uncharacterized protein n=1 Tax=Brachionus plicatilis TaxID=10195 RepID=A0A3M7P3Q9_BRAPC|nr:hypothetical protein BpHYR1_040725 [Brachionus plicatilis]
MDCYNQFRFHIHLRLWVWIFLVHLRVFVDLFANLVEACPFRTLNAEELARKFYFAIITRHGCPSNF